jgi:hypothetical protein
MAKTIEVAKNYSSHLRRSAKKVEKNIKTHLIISLCRIGLNKRITVCIFPSSRKRYLKQLTLNKPKHFKFNFWDLDSIDFEMFRELRGVHIVLSSDFVVDGMNFSETNFTENLVELFIWNDEEETILNVNSLKLGQVKILSFFRDTLVQNREIGIYDVNYPSYRIKSTRPLRRRTQRILFAGQVNSGISLEVITNSKWLSAGKDQIMERIESSDYQFLFDEESYEADYTTREKILLRHFGVNYWREKILLEIEQLFGPDLVLIGNDFLDSKYKKATLVGYTEDLQSWYSGSAVNLDLGSQCGLEYIYPRTLEIRSLNPDSLFHYERESLKPNWPESRYWSSALDLQRQILILRQ